MMVEALQTQAMMQAIISPQSAEKAAKAYLEAALPMDPMIAELKAWRKKQALKEFHAMGPIPINQSNFGHTVKPPTTSFRQAKPKVKKNA
jgi:hypothetical protein